MSVEQPCAMMAVTMGKDATVPTREPESMTAVANARSVWGTHDDAALVVLG
jgi:hypothetical protein